MRAFAPFLSRMIEAAEAAGVAMTPKWLHTTPEMKALLGEMKVTPFVISFNYLFNPTYSSPMNVAESIRHD